MHPGTKPPDYWILSCACCCCLTGTLCLTLQSVGSLWGTLPCTSPLFLEVSRQRPSQTQNVSQTIAPKDTKAEPHLGPVLQMDLPERRKDNSSALCNPHWTWSGVASFWKVSRSSGSYIEWNIQRGGGERREEFAEWSRGEPCEKGGAVQEGTAVVVVQSADRFSPNIWHRMTAIFEAWVTPRVLQLKKVLGDYVTIYYYVEESPLANVKTDKGPYQWHLLGTTTSKDCGFEHRIIAPWNGFLWDLAWDLRLLCVRSDLWLDFQAAAFAGVGVRQSEYVTRATGRSVCYMARPGSTRELSDASIGRLRQATNKVLLDKQPLGFHYLNLTYLVPIKEQVAKIYMCDILVGVHGAGLIHSMWMYPQSAVVEILDQEHLAAGYFRNIAHLSGHTYFKLKKSVLESDSSLVLGALTSAAHIVSNKAAFSRTVEVMDKMWQLDVSHFA